MNWRRQVWLVVRKDARHNALALTGYVVLVMAMTFLLPSALSGGPMDGGSAWTSTSTFSMWLLAVLIIAIGVQDDSPANETGFWRTTPLRSSAIFAAKIANAAVLLLIATIGQAGILAWEGVSTSNIGPTLMASASTAPLALLLVIVVAMATRDLQNFFVALVFVPVSAFVAGNLWPTELVPFPGAPLFAGAGAAGAIFLMWSILRGRLSRRSQMVACVAVTACILVAYFDNASARDVSATEVAGTDAPVAITLRYVPDSASAQHHSSSSSTWSSDGVSRTSFTLPVTAAMPGASRAERHVMRRGDAIVTLADGSRLTAPLTTWGTVLSPGDSVPYAFPIWLGDPCVGDSASPLAIMVTDSERIALRRGIKAVRIDGDIVVEAPRVTATVRAEPGASVATGFGSVTVSSVSTSEKTTTIVSRSIRTIPRHPGFPLMVADWHECALVNERTRFAVPVTSGVGESGTTVGLLLPGPGLNRHIRSLKVSAGAIQQDPRFTTTETWMRDARIAIIDWDIKARHRGSGAMEMPR